MIGHMVHPLMERVRPICRSIYFPLLVSLSAFAIWLFSIEQTSPYGMGDLGLITVLPFSFFVAFVLLTLSFFLALFHVKQGKKSARIQGLLFAQVFMLILFLYLTPTLAEGARLRFAYGSYGRVDYIVRNGNINPETITSHNWPTFPIFTSISVSVSGISPDFLMGIASPFLLMVMFSFPLLFFMRSVLKDPAETWIGIWVFYAAEWVGRLYLSSQGIGFFVYLLLLVFLFGKDRSKGIGLSRADFVVLLLLFCTLTMGHLLDSIAILGILFMFLVLGRVVHLRAIGTNLLILFSTIAIAWTVFGGMFYFQSNVAHFASSVGRIEGIFSSNVSNRVTGSASRVLTDRIRIIYTSMVLLFVVTGLYISHKTGHSSKMDKKIVLGLVGLFILSTFIVYGGELYQRLYMFALPLFAYFVSKNIRSSKIFAFLAIFLIAVTPSLGIIATYGGEKWDYISQSEIAGRNFAYGTILNGYFIGGYPWGDFEKTPDHYVSVPMGSIEEWEEIVPFNIKLSNENLTSYIIIGKGDREYALRFLGNSTLLDSLETKMNLSPLYDKVYSNPGFDMYVFKAYSR